MNNRYLFRGKQIDNREWVSGYLCAATIYEGREPFVSAGVLKSVAAIQHEAAKNYYVIEAIDPATAGQCTGLIAAKSYRGDSEVDRLIFEGDIVESISYNELFSVDSETPKLLRRRCAVEYRHGQLLLVERFAQCDSDIETEWCMCKQGGNDLEIVGNIHDRPEPK